MSPPELFGVAVDVHLLHGGMNHARRVVVDLISIPSAHDPSGFILHQFPFLFAIYPQRLQKTSVRLGEEEGFEGNLGFDHLKFAALPVTTEVFVDQICSDAPSGNAREPSYTRSGFGTNRLLPIQGLVPPRRGHVLKDGRWRRHVDLSPTEARLKKSRRRGAKSFI